MRSFITDRCTAQNCAVLLLPPCVRGKAGMGAIAQDLHQDDDRHRTGFKPLGR